jgi:hypothetical protein
MGHGGFAELPPVAAWQLTGAYQGFEVVRFARTRGGTVLEGTTVGTEDGVPWTIHYVIEVADDWRVRRARITDYTGSERRVSTDGSGSWMVNSERHPEFDGCLDLDLEASVVTNTLPVHRLSLAEGQRGESAAVYVRTVRLAVERLDQTYHRLPDSAGMQRFLYESPRFGYRDTLQFGSDGLAVAYPGIGRRVE